MAKAKTLVGLDVHATKIVAAVLDAETGQLQTFQMDGDAVGAARFCAGLPRPFVFAGLLGFFYGTNFSGTVVLAQEYLPNRLGLASAVTLGAAMGVGELAAALLGPLADSAGLTTVIVVIAALPLPGLALALSLTARTDLGVS